MDMHTLRKKHRAAVDAAEDLIYKSQADKRDLSAAEVADVQRLTAEAKSWKDHISTREAEERLLNSPIAKIHSIGARTTAGGKAVHPMAKSVLDFHGVNFKGLAAAGSVLTPESFAATPVREGELPATIRDLITATQTGTDRFAYLRQTGRTNRATTVERGGLKPTSDYEITRVEDRCRTVAHLSSPIQRQDLDDATTLQEFVSAELVYGLGQAVEEQLLNGNTSTAGNLDDLTGLLHTSGVVVAGWDSDLLTTSRKAVTAQANLANAPSAWIMNPSDWERFDLLNDQIGRPLVDTNYYQDLAARKLWGLPVVQSVHLAQGTAILGDFRGSITAYERESVRVDWSESLWDPNLLGTGSGANLFSTNQVIFRCEARIGLAVLRPSAFSKVTLTAPPPSGG
jgi:HK97 family phage major capsid protein